MKRLMALFVQSLLFSSTAFAGCPHPYIPAQTTSNYMDVESVSLNYYAEGSIVCFMNIVEEFCGANCEVGYRHSCERNGTWRRLLECTNAEKEKTLNEYAQLKKQDKELQTEAALIQQERLDSNSKKNERGSKSSSCSVLRNQDQSRALMVQDKEKWIRLANSCE